MRTNRAVRIILAVIVLLLLGVYSYIHFGAAPFSRDMNPGGTGNDIAEEKAPAETPPAEEEAPSQEAEITAEPEPAATPVPTVDPNSPEGRAAALGLPKPPDIDITSWEFIMANPDHSIAEYVPPLYHYETKAMPANIMSNQYGDGLRVDERIVEPLTAFITDAGAQGLNVYLSSAYRSFDEQTANFQRKLNEGMSEETAKRIVAVPGTSEHQTGLAADITDKYYPLKDSSLENTELYKWMSAHCHEYGFIVRFPKDKEDITQIIYEPWHYRYVGVEAATYMVENNLCYEEFYALYTD